MNWFAALNDQRRYAVLIVAAWVVADEDHECEVAERLRLRRGGARKLPALAAVAWSRWFGLPLQF